MAAIEQATAVFRRSDRSQGGRMCRPMVVAKLRSVLALRHASCPAEVRERLLVATADLGLLAVNVARQAKHPYAADLTTHLLMDMAHQSLHLRRPQEALRLVQLGYGVGARRAQSVSASTASSLACHQAMCQAALGEAQACARGLDQVVGHFAHADDLGTTAPWAGYLTTAELAAQQGHAQYTLALATADPKHAARAVPLLREAVEGFGPVYARNRALNLPELAGAHALTDDLDIAASVSHHAVEEITALASPRAYDRLRTLDTALRPRDTIAAISEVRHQIQAALVTV